MDRNKDDFGCDDCFTKSMEIESEPSKGCIFAKEKPFLGEKEDL